MRAVVADPHRQDRKVLLGPGQGRGIAPRSDLAKAGMADDVSVARGREQLRVAGDGHLGRAGVILRAEMEDDLSGRQPYREVQ